MGEPEFTDPVVPLPLDSPERIAIDGVCYIHSRRVAEMNVRAIAAREAALGNVPEVDWNAMVDALMPALAHENELRGVDMSVDAFRDLGFDVGPEA